MLCLYDNVGKMSFSPLINGENISMSKTKTEKHSKDEKVMDEDSKFDLIPVAGNRYIHPLSLFETKNLDKWEEAYDKTMDKKYKKGTRNYSKKIDVPPLENVDEAPIYLIPRERGGPSYKEVDLVGVDASKVRFCPISKGFSMQDVSSFTLGPIPGHGLCLVNSAYSKSICIMHIVGGGKCDLTRKNFWKPGKPIRRIELQTRIADQTLLASLNVTNSDSMIVDGKEWIIEDWLRAHEDEWLFEWTKWSRSVALCSMGDFHWTDSSPTVAYRYKKRYLGFVDWKKKCYIKPSMKLLKKCKTYKFLKQMFRDKIPLGLVHPKAKTGQTELPVTREYLREVFDCENRMCCQPLVVAAKLLRVKL
jgi:hypothetical protein